MGNYYSYKRISTDTERQNFNRQIKSLERYAAEHEIEYLIEFSEERSAKNFTDRPQFKKLDKILQDGDVVVFKDLSRFTREAENGYAKYMEWLKRGISIVFIDNPTVSSDYIRQMMMTAEQQGHERGHKTSSGTLYSLRYYTTSLAAPYMPASLLSFARTIGVFAQDENARVR